jgi:hypothetical protein
MVFQFVDLEEDGLSIQHENGSKLHSFRVIFEGFSSVSFQFGPSIGGVGWLCHR